MGKSGWEDLRVKATECKYKERKRRLRAHFIDGIDDQTMTAEIINELTMIKDTSEVKRERVQSQAEN